MVEVKLHRNEKIQKQKSFILWSEPMVKFFLAKSKICKLSTPPPYQHVEKNGRIVQLYHSFPPVSEVHRISEQLGTVRSTKNYASDFRKK